MALALPDQTRQLAAAEDPATAPPEPRLDRIGRAGVRSFLEGRSLVGGIDRGLTRSISVIHGHSGTVVFTKFTSSFLPKSMHTEVRTAARGSN